jgi:hypothetical protein
MNFRSMSVCTGLLLLINSQASLRAQVTHEPIQLSVLGTEGGGPPPCGKDGILNCRACANDPDCPAIPPISSGWPTAIVDAKCNGKTAVFGSATPFGLATSMVVARYPTLHAAQKADNPSFIDSHPSGPLATGHGELEGYGVTMIQGKRSEVIENASGDLADPSVLFFEKVGGHEDDWGITGMGYAYKLDNNNEHPPTQISAVDPGIWWVHEAGYHRSPGDGGFTCATNDDLHRSAFDAKKRIDQAACLAINRDDLKTREFHADRKHGRYWVLHVWFEPKTRRPTIALTDPWCRQSADAVSVPSCAFRKQGQCGGSTR